jgi:hypothetical protein
MGGAAWHAIRTRPGAEARVLVAAQALGLQALLPAAFEPATQRGNYRGGPVVWRPLFACCVFVALDVGRDDLARLQRLDGVDGLVAPVAGKVIAALRVAEQQGAFDRADGCRSADGAARPLNGRLAALIGKIRAARWSSAKQTMLLTMLLQV